AAGLCGPWHFHPVHASRRDERCRSARCQCWRRSALPRVLTEAAMSRVGKYPVEIPQGVEVAVAGRLLTAKGKLGELKLALTERVDAAVDGNKVTVTP